MWKKGQERPTATQMTVIKKEDTIVAVKVARKQGSNWIAGDPFLAN